MTKWAPSPTPALEAPEVGTGVPSSCPAVYPGWLIAGGMLVEQENNVARGAEWDRGDGARGPQGSELCLVFSGVAFLPHRSAHGESKAVVLH